MKILDTLEKLRAAATQEWQQALHIDEPRALVSKSRPMESLLGLDRDGMAIFDRAEDCAVAVAAVSALDELVAVARAASELHDHAMSWCAAVPSCGNCRACRLRLAIQRLAAKEVGGGD